MEESVRQRHWYERSWVLVLVCVVAVGISVYSVIDLLGDDPDWIRSVVFTLFGPATLVLGYDAYRKRPPA